ncbi:MAG: nitroreductase family protein [Geobacter sp.]|nr:MAG: nitroreductase family protein [Geobacter sp.]
MENNHTIYTIARRRSTRLFNDKEVSKKDILMVLEAANQAPSAHNRQPWRFSVVGETLKNDLASLANTLAVKFPKPYSTLLRLASRSVSSAPVVVIVTNTGDLVQHGSELFEADGQHAAFFRTMEVQSSAAAVQNLLLATTSLGLSCVWLGIFCLIKEDVLSLLNMRDADFMAVIPLGYSTRQSSSPRKKSLDATVTYFE